MGEYASYRGAEIKIGTCESMYYLRADQAHLVEPLPGSVDPLRQREQIRFRFPFPDEDEIEPGCFTDYERGERIPGWRIPLDWHGHHAIQFRADAGYLVSLPCPESLGVPGFSVETPEGLTIHRNGFSGWPVVTQQRYLDGRLLTVVACGACGGAWRLPTLELAQEVADCFIVEAQRTEYRRDLDAFVAANSEQRRTYLRTIADRILDGYVREEVPA